MNFPPGRHLPDGHPTGPPSPPQPGPPQPRQARPHTPWKVQHGRTVLFPVIVIAVASIALILALGHTLFAVGLTLPLAIIPATIPVLIVLSTLLWIDRWEPEPSKMLIAALLWGAGISVVTSLIGSALLNAVWSGTFGSEVAKSLGTIITAPVVEEAFKGTFLVLLLLTQRRVINGVVDGLVYAGLVGLGFAFVENLLYLSSALLDGGPTGFVMTFVLRCLLGPFAHPLFTAMTGLAVGYVARRGRSPVSYLLVVVGYIGAVVLHAIWNASANVSTVAYLMVYGLFMVPVFIGMIVLVVSMRRREHRTLRRHLLSFVQQGWVPPNEVEPLTSLAGRRRWRSRVRSRAGRDAKDALSDYHTAVTELAFLRERIDHGATGPQIARWHDEILTTLIDARTRVHQHPQAFPAIQQLPPQPPPPTRRF